MDLVILESMGIQIFRSYFFVAIYQHFENLLIKLCNEKENNPDLINFRDIYGKNCIDKCKTFLTKVVKIRLPDETPWQKMSNYNKLRNIIVHNRSQIDSSQRGNEILKFAKGNKSLYLLNDLYEDNKEQFEYGEMNDVIDNYEIILEKGFCEEALDDFDLFINSLEDQMKNQPEPT
jgi:hypothetical protein